MPVPISHQRAAKEATLAGLNDRAVTTPKSIAMYGLLCLLSMRIRADVSSNMNAIHPGNPS